MVLTGPQAGQLVGLEQALVVLGRAADADLVVQEPSVSAYHARIARVSDVRCCVEDLGSTNGTFVDGRRISLSPLEVGDRLQLGPDFALRFAITDDAEESLHRRLYDSATRDPLTHVFNRWYLDNRLVTEVTCALRTQTHAAVLMADVDGLKQINDRFGHAAGDDALRMAAARVLGAIREGDCVARYGGDEFVILATGADGAEAAQLAERVRRAVEGLHLSVRGESVPITLSIGAASLSELGSTEEAIAALLELADTRMYRAKASGRNRVCFGFLGPRVAT